MEHDVQVTISSDLLLRHRCIIIVLVILVVNEMFNLTRSFDFIAAAWNVTDPRGQNNYSLWWCRFFVEFEAICELAQSDKFAAYVGFCCEDCSNNHGFCEFTTSIANFFDWKIEFYNGDSRIVSRLNRI